MKAKLYALLPGVSIQRLLLACCSELVRRVQMVDYGGNIKYLNSAWLSSGKLRLLLLRAPANLQIESLNLSIRLSDYPSILRLYLTLVKQKLACFAGELLDLASKLSRAIEMLYNYHLRAIQLNLIANR